MTKITQLAAGDLSATSTDAVNGSQLYATNQNVTQNTSDISGLDTRVTINESELETNTNDIAVLDARVSDHDSAFAGMVAAFGGGAALDRQSVVEGRRVSVSVDRGGRRQLQKKN